MVSVYGKRALNNAAIRRLSVCLSVCLSHALSLTMIHYGAMVTAEH